MSRLVWETSTVLVIYRFCAQFLRIYGWFNQIYRTSLLFRDQKMFMLLPWFLPCHFWNYSSQSQKKRVNFNFYHPLSKLEPTTDVDHNIFFKPKWHFDWLIEQKRSHKCDKHLKSQIRKRTNSIDQSTQIHLTLFKLL